jgi:class 3 adenylate cyclase
MADLNDHDRQVLSKLAVIADAISKGNYDEVDDLFQLTKIGAQASDLTELAEAFGMMAVKVEAREYQLEKTIADLHRKNEELQEALRQLDLQTRMKEVLARFVPRIVQSRIESNPEKPDLEKHESDVTVMFLDVGNYTGLSAQLDTVETNELIEAYFSSFLDDLYQGGGDINETAGDGLMVIFQDDDPLAHAREAARTALIVREKVKQLNLTREGRHPPVFVNIGINSGPALVGSTRIRAAGMDRWTFTASGMVTNLAGRLCKLATEGAIFVAPETATRLGENFIMEMVGPQTLKNVAEPVPVFQVHSTGTNP